jgi:hypothetical protein
VHLFDGVALPFEQKSTKVAPENVCNFSQKLHTFFGRFQLKSIVIWLFSVCNFAQKLHTISTLLGVQLFRQVGDFSVAFYQKWNSRAPPSESVWTPRPPRKIHRPRAATTPRRARAQAFLKNPFQAKGPRSKINQKTEPLAKFLSRAPNARNCAELKTNTTIAFLDLCFCFLIYGEWFFPLARCFWRVARRQNVEKKRGKTKIGHTNHEP